MVYVEFADAEDVVITHQEAAFGVDAGHVCSELPTPAEFVSLLPIVLVVRLASPPKPNRFALDAARIAITTYTPVADGRDGAIRFAGRALSHLVDMAGRTIGGVTVATVRDPSGPEVSDDANDDAIEAMASALVLLRPPPTS